MTLAARGEDDEFVTDLPSELERRLEAEAKRQGISTDALARNRLEEKLKLEDQNGSSDLPRVLASDLPIRDRSREAEWLRSHRDEYADLSLYIVKSQTVALG